MSVTTSVDVRRDDRRGASASKEIIVGISGVRQNAAVAACVGGELVAVCEQERLTRRRRIGIEPGTLPDESVAAVLQLSGAADMSAVRQFATAEDSLVLPPHLPMLRFDHHYAHAATAFHLSPFESAAVLVCDRNGAQPTTVWTAAGGTLTNVEWPSRATGLAGLYSECTRLFGFGPGQEHRLEALARLDRGGDAGRFDDVIGYTDGAIWASIQWRRVVADWLAEDTSLRHKVRIAGAFQRHLGGMLLALVSDIRAMSGTSALCLGGGLFYNTFFTTLIQQFGRFDEVFVAPNPGNAGLAAGVALAASETAPRRTAPTSPFLGPEYTLEEIKATLDNCKLSYECVTEHQVIDETVNALQKGHLVGWFQGRMEWGHRALGNRSILANPLSPYFLENLNLFLKHRERYRAYGLSVPERDAARFFSGPRRSMFMEYEYRLAADGGPLKHAAPEGAEALRVQTIPDASLWFDRFRTLHDAFGAATGVPVLVNTSFNGFSEPIVASPRDAIRVFYGTGLDLLVLDRFVIRK